MNYLQWNKLLQIIFSFVYLSGSISDLRGFGSGIARFEAGSANENRGTQFAQLAHINVDELSDDGLANVIDELKTAVRRFSLETIMFEGMSVKNIIDVNIPVLNILTVGKTKNI